MKSLEQDALKAQMVIAKSKEGRKRGTLDQLAESPSPVPTPSPTPMEGESFISIHILAIQSVVIYWNEPDSHVFFFLLLLFFFPPFSEQMSVLALWHHQVDWYEILFILAL